MSQRVGLVWSEAFLVHDPGPGHPEGADRLAAIRDRLSRADLNLRELPPRDATMEELYFVHRPEYVEHVETRCRERNRTIDSLDTGICAESFQVARLAAGSGVTALEAIQDNQIDRAFCPVRPPGHHAEVDRAMGFCLFNNVAVTARAAQSAQGWERVLICDFDVHHGNGTQHIFYEDERVFYMSVHQSPFYPGTGAANETGAGTGEGTTLNVPLPAGCGDEEFVGAVAQLEERMADFSPDLVLISAGFDALGSDPLGGMKVTLDGYRRMTRLLCDIADEHASGRVVSLLEGGYDRPGTAAAVEAHLHELKA